MRALFRSLSSPLMRQLSIFKPSSPNCGRRDGDHAYSSTISRFATWWHSPRQPTNTLYCIHVTALMGRPKLALEHPYFQPRRLWLPTSPCSLGPPQCRFDHVALGEVNRESPNMLAVLCSSPRPPLGVALLGLTIIMLRWVLHLLPYAMFCSMITLSVWPPSQPLPPDVSYYTCQLDTPTKFHTVYTRADYRPSKEAWSFELNAGLRILVFLLAVPVTSVVENAFFRPTRSIFLRTIECWFDMRYVHPAQMSGTWPKHLDPHFQCASLVRVRGRFHRRRNGPEFWS
ncbi:hypothetical protein H4582DRAFT_1303504 [Lactarius indigo]|nr:hypothetical protein H4582DRAFT_1303504 [Lactarius indigo]